MPVALFFALYCLEAGLFFIIAPWTRFWAVNPLLHADSTVAILTASPFVRGFVSGIGLVHLVIALRDLLALSSQRKAQP